jgi:hypothetical protein
MCADNLHRDSPGSRAEFKKLDRSAVGDYRSAMDKRDWTQYLLPLPKKFSTSGTIRCTDRSIHVEVRGTGEILEAAAQHLLDLLGSSPQATLSQAPSLTIELLTLDSAGSDKADTDTLLQLPNADQAYRIRMVTDDHVRICGLQPAGVFYGALTLSQLLVAGRDGEQIEIPRLEVVDWPDLEERGLWNFHDSDSWIPWMAGMKLNYGKMADTAHPNVVRGEPGYAVIDTDLQAIGKRLAFHYVPYIVHLNFLHDIGLFQAYPELAGVGDEALAGRYYAHKQGNQHRAPCASQPILVDLLCDWLRSIADQGAEEISCWLSERPCQCQCEQCTPVGQFLLETRAFLAAWTRVSADHPGLSIRIFSSTTTPEQDDRILAELPPEVKFERACATSMDRVSHQPRDLFRNTLIDNAAATGRWVASYDVPIGAFGNVDTPEFKVPQYSAQRIRDFVGQLHERNFSGAYGMLAWGTMGQEVCGFAICALAEYSWNTRGRSVGEFARAWATLQGICDPDAFGDWAELLGEIEFDVYDSAFPMCYSWGQAAALVENRQPPSFGAGLFRHFASVDDFDRKLRSCDDALALLQDLQRQELVAATGVVSSYVGLARAIWKVSDLFAHADLTSLVHQDRLRGEVEILESAGAANVAAIQAWRACLGAEPWHHRVHDAIGATQSTVSRISRHIRDGYLY